MEIERVQDTTYRFCITQKEKNEIPAGVDWADFLPVGSENLLSPVLTWDPMRKRYTSTFQILHMDREGSLLSRDLLGEEDLTKPSRSQCYADEQADEEAAEYPPYLVDLIRDVHDLPQPEEKTPNHINPRLLEAIRNMSHGEKGYSELYMGTKESKSLLDKLLEVCSEVEDGFYEIQVEDNKVQSFNLTILESK